MFLVEACVLASAIRKAPVPSSRHRRIRTALILLHTLMTIVTTAGSGLYQVNITISYPYGILA